MKCTVCGKQADSYWQFYLGKEITICLECFDITKIEGSNSRISLFIDGQFKTDKEKILSITNQK